MNNFSLKILIFGLFFLFAPLALWAVADFDLEVPVILPRATWENSSDLTKLMNWYPEIKEEENKLPDYSDIERIIIHDMGYDVEYDPLTIIQNIYRYHAVTRGWGDIGYHYIVDYLGNIYEGRYGGNGVRGTHTYYDRRCDNFNVGSVSILLMGNYEKTELPETMYKSLIKLVAWIAVTNDLNPQEINHISKIWHSPETEAGCDISQGSLISTYKGPVVVGHKDVEEGNSDPGLVNLNRVRQEAGKLYLKYKNYIYTTQNSLKVYTITNGVKSEVNFYWEPSSLVVLNRNQLDAFPSFTINEYTDGTLIKSYSRGRIYLFEKNKRRPIFSEKLFNLKNLNWADVEFLSDRDLAKYSLGMPIKYPDGILLKGDGPEIYLIEDGTRKHIGSPILFENKGFEWKNIIKISQAELLVHSLGEKILFSDGTLIKEEKLPPVYLVKNKKRYWIKNPNVFLSLGYKWKDVIILSSQEIIHYLPGSIEE